MKSKLGIFLLSVFAFLLIFSSCNKETGEDFLVSKSWSFDKLETDATDSMILFFIEFFELAYTGSSLSFSDDGTFSLSALDQSGSGTWTLSDDEETLTMEDDSSSFVYTVMTLTESELSYYETETEGDLSYKIEFYWK